MSQLKVLTDQLNQLLSDEDLDESKLQQASEGLLPNIADYLNSCQGKITAKDIFDNYFDLKLVKVKEYTNAEFEKDIVTAIQYALECERQPPPTGLVEEMAEAYADERFDADNRRIKMSEEFVHHKVVEAFIAGASSVGSEARGFVKYMAEKQRSLLISMTQNNMSDNMEVNIKNAYTLYLQNKK